MSPIRFLRPSSRPLQAIAITALVALASGCSDGTATRPATSSAAALGAKIFADTSLSASGRQSCQSCHDVASGLAAPNALAVQPGGVNLERSGVRNSPSAAYLHMEFPFRLDPEDGPVGGFFWDGRASSLAAQAAGPFVNPLEMAMPDHAAVVAKLAQAPYAEEFKAVYGRNVFDDVETAYRSMTEAIAQFESEDPRFRAFTSKYDEYLRGHVALSAQEQRGLAVFEDENKGNCAACHPSSRDEQGGFPLFTDRTYDNLGIPRNPEIPANADPAYHDLGLCNRADIQAAHPELCGAFKVPSLRNVALRHSFFHNGRFHTLKEALAFYVQRDIYPEKFYPRKADGTVDKFDDLPPEYRANVNQEEVPYNRHPGDQPALTDAEIDDLIAFLGTLSDGYAALPSP
jgi:cytochrome c peroxidase